ncbi:phage tail spike protein [Lactobacillus iners]|jgi:phage minor structural protein, N-terminal domain protein|uniref:Tail spike domain-containing protein n=1 Tax=Lactobacillus iners TaxID=147802 RepID=A0A6G7B860_9LACO|nr:phage tail spike protein [Lactobacillus iners]QIH23600.1 hypothetical protein G6Z83_02465 [Lactobacillus iners]DAY42714.1 MAG TPA: tail protein [Caudoviricetes sp.]
MRLLLFDNHEQCFAVVTRAISATISQEINVFDELSVEVPKTATNVKNLERAMYIGVPIKQDNRYQLFKMEKPETGDSSITVTAIEAASDDLSVQGYIDDRRFVDKAISAVIPAIFEGSTWEFQNYVPDNDLENINFYKISRKEAISKLISTYGVEVQFFYKVEGNRIIQKLCEIHKQIGSERSIRIVEGKNATSIKYTVNQTELYTAAIGRGAGVATTDDSGDATGGYSRKIEFDDVVWSKRAGNPVDKPAGQNYVEIPEATQKYGWLDKAGNRQPRLAIFDFDNEQDKAKLLQKTYDKLQKLAGPQVLVETTVAKLGKLPMLGDGVTVVAYHPHKFVVHSRVIKRKIDLIDEAYSNLEIGTSNIERQAEREKTIQTDIHTSKAETDKNFSELNQKTDDFYKNLETKINETADEQTRRAQEAIKRVEDDVKEKVESTRAEIDQYINQNSNGPIELIDTNGNFIQGVGKIKEIRSEDGSFVLNSSGFNFGGRLLGGKGKLYADDIVGREITGYTVTGAHIIGGTIDGVTIDGANFIRSTVGGTAVLSGEHGFSHNGDTALGNGMLRLGNQWLDETMLAAIKEKCGV